MKKQQGGYATPLILITLLLFTSILSGLFLVQQSHMKTLDTWTTQFEHRRERERVFIVIKNLFEEHYPPEEISPHSSFWNELPQKVTLESSGISFTVTYEELSSRINPNWIRDDFFEKTNFSAYLKSQEGQKLEEFRQQNGFSLDLNHYEDFFKDDSLKELTSYSWVNINLGDPSSQEFLYAQRVGDEGRGRTYFNRLQQNLQSNQVVQISELEDFLEDDYEKLFPVINAFPMWNVNYMKEDLLRAILQHKSYKIEKRNQKAQNLIIEREEKELGLEDLYRVLALEKKSRFYHYIGTQSYFWKIILESPEDGLYGIISLIPQVSKLDEVTWKAILRTWGEFKPAPQW